MTLPPSPAAVHRGRTAQCRGLAAEAAACAALEAEGWTVLGRRLRTEAGEVDAVAEKDGLLAVLEVKSVAGVRFDVLVVDAAGAVRRIADAFRLEG